jgi:hypothetical protein
MTNLTGRALSVAALAERQRPTHQLTARHHGETTGCGGRRRTMGAFITAR